MRECINKLAKNYHQCEDNCEGKACKGVFFVDLESQRRIMLRDYIYDGDKLDDEESETCPKCNGTGKIIKNSKISKE